MSAFIVGEDHIRYLVTAGLEHARQRYRGSLSWYSHGTRESSPHHLGTLTDASASSVGKMLWRENWESVRYRYSDGDELPGPSGMGRNFPPVYQHQAVPFTLISPLQTLQAIACYEYQSCEHPGWHDSEARCFCDALRLAAIGCLPGYDDQQWEVRVPSPAPAPLAAPPAAPPARREGEGAKYRAGATLAEIKAGIQGDIARAVRAKEFPAAQYKVSARQSRGAGCRPDVRVTVAGLSFPINHPDRLRMFREIGNDHPYHGPWMSDEASALHAMLRSLVNAYGYDRSDAMTDYFDYAFNVDVRFADEGAEVTAARAEGEAARRAATSAS